VGASTKLRWKQCINELRFVSEERSLVQEIAAAGAREFQHYYEDYCGRQNIDLGSLNNTHAQKLQEIYKEKSTDGGEDNPQLDAETDCALVPHSLFTSEGVNSGQAAGEATDQCDYEMTKDDLEMHEAFSKVFKKLALVLHPDKIDAGVSESEREERTIMFRDCAKALEERKYFILLDLAEKFNVTFPRNYRQQIRWMKKEVKHIEEETRQHQKTYNYLFAHAETEKEKDNIIRQFMTQLFGAEIFHQ
jgi:hypothetical protein